MAFINLIPPMPVMGVKNPIGIRIQADAAWQSFDNYYIQLELELEDSYKSNTFSVLDFDTRGYPNQAGQIEFDISRLLAPRLSMDRPSLDLTAAAVCQNANLRYRYTLREFQNDVETASITVGPFHAVRAGIHRTKGDPLSNENLMSYVGTQFLTHAPASMEITAFHPLWLYALMPTGVSNIDLEVERLYIDDTSDTVNKFPLAVGDWDLVYMPAGYFQLDLENGAAQQIKGWRVRIRNSDTGDYLTETREYLAACECTPLDRFYFFENSLSGLDTLRTTGELKAAQNTAEDSLVKVDGPFYDPTRGNIGAANTRFSESFSQHTGHLTRAENKWLRDLLNTEEAWRLGDWDFNPEAAGDFWPIRIARGRQELAEDNRFLWGISFQYSDAFENRGL